MKRIAWTRRPLASRIMRVLAVICLSGWIPADMPLRAADTGVRGMVMWGPVVPGPTCPGQINDVPLRASFQVLSAERKVAGFESDKNGQFEVSLPAGNYTVVPDKSTPIPFPERQKTTFTVPEDGFADITIRLDTGMR